MSEYCFLIEGFKICSHTGFSRCTIKKYSENSVEKEVHISNNEKYQQLNSLLLFSQNYFYKIVRIQILDEILRQVNLRTTFPFVWSLCSLPSWFPGWQARSSLESRGWWACVRHAQWTKGRQSQGLTAELCTEKLMAVNWSWDFFFKLLFFQLCFKE